MTYVPHDTSTFERITSAEFSANMDQYLDRVSEEKIAYVIVHNGKEYVLCPAEWICCEEIDDLSILVTFAVRYALTKNSSAPLTMQGLLRNYMPCLPERCLKGVLEDIDDRLDQYPESTNPVWKEVRAEILNYLNTTEKAET